MKISILWHGFEISPILADWCHKLNHCTKITQTALIQCGQFVTEQGNERLPLLFSAPRSSCPSLGIWPRSQRMPFQCKLFIHGIRLQTTVWGRPAPGLHMDKYFLFEWDVSFTYHNLIITYWNIVGKYLTEVLSKSVRNSWKNWDFFLKLRFLVVSSQNI